MRVEGRLALVTGASSGIGEATVRSLAAQGARVVLVARSADKLEAIAHDIKTDGGGARAVAADLANPDDVARMSEVVRREAGDPDILINNAGAGRWLSVIETSPEEALRMIELPYLAAFYTTKAFLPAMMTRRSGHIVSVTSPASFIVWPNAAGYIAARQALKGFTDGLRLEVAPHGIRVSMVVLGTVESTYWEHNPGSRERVPKGFSPLSTAQAAEAVVRAIIQDKNFVVRPALFRFLFALEGIVPGLAARR